MENFLANIKKIATKIFQDSLPITEPNEHNYLGKGLIVYRGGDEETWTVKIDRENEGIEYFSWSNSVALPVMSFSRIQELINELNYFRQEDLPELLKKKHVKKEDKLIF